MQRVAIVFIGSVLIGAGGCTEQTTFVNYQTRVIAELPANEVLEAAVPIMQEEFGRVSVDRSSMTITVAPREYVSASATGSARDLMGIQSTLRRHATLRIRRGGDQTLADLRIDIERKDTGRRTAGAEGSRLTDAPSQTPIDREGATTERQNTLWVKVRRDVQLERALLDQLQDWGTRASGKGESDGEDSTDSRPAVAQPAASESVGGE